MLLTIHNLPSRSRLDDIRRLLFDRCGLEDVVLDKFLLEGNSRRVTVGLADEVDAALVMRRLDGMYYEGMQLQIEDKRHKSADQSFNFKSGSVTHHVAEKRSYDQINEPTYQQQYIANEAIVQPVMQPAANEYPAPYPNMPFYMQNSFNYDTPVRQSIQYPEYGKTDMQTQNQWNPQPTQSYEYQNQLGFSLATMKEIPSRNPPITGSDMDSRRNRDDYGRKPDNSRSSDRNYSDRGSGKRSKWNEDSKFDARRESTTIRRDDKREGRRTHSQADSYSGSRDKLRSGNNRSPPRYQNRDHTRSESNESRDKYRYENPTRSFSSDAHNSRSWKDQSRHDSNESKDKSRYEVFSKLFSSGPNNSRSWKDETKPDSKEFSDNYHYETLNKSLDSNPNKSGQDQTMQDFNVSRDNYRFEKPPTTFSSDPNNSTFKKPVDKKVVFNTRTFSKRENVRPEKSYQNIQQGPKPSKNLKRGPEDFQRRMLRHTNWRYQAAATIAKEVLKNANVMFPENRLVHILKECIVARIDVIMEGKIADTLLEMIETYRKKFVPDEDVKFLQAVDEKCTRIYKEKSEMKAELAQEKREEKQVSYMEPPKLQPLSVKSDGRIPKHLNSDKKMANSLRKMQKLELSDEYGFRLEPALKDALENELGLLYEEFENAISSPNDEDMQKVANSILGEPFSKFKKVFEVHTTKRLLNVCTGLNVRVFFSGRAPNRDQLDTFLKKFGVIGLKKSVREKMFVATCSHYKGFDALCEHPPVNIGGSTLRFKSLHITGIPDKKNRKKTNEKSLNENTPLKKEETVEVNADRNIEDSAEHADEEDSNVVAKEIENTKSRDVSNIETSGENMDRMNTEDNTEKDWVQEGGEGWDVDENIEDPVDGVDFTEDDLEDF